MPLSKIERSVPAAIAHLHVRAMMRAAILLFLSLMVAQVGCAHRPSSSAEQLVGTWFCPYFDTATPLRLVLDRSGQWSWFPGIRPGEESITPPGPSQQGTWVIHNGRLSLRVLESQSDKIRVGDTFHFRILSVSTSTVSVADLFSYTDIDGREGSEPETGSVTWNRKP